MKLAVIIPVYNTELFLNNLLTMAVSLEKLYKIKFYFVNDFSTDNSGKILEKYKHKFVVINNFVNLGPAQTRQRGLINAIADANNTHFTFLDSDDHFYLKSMKIINHHMKYYENTTIKYAVSNKNQSLIQYNYAILKRCPVKIRNNIPYLFSPTIYSIIIARKHINHFLYSKKINFYFEDGILAHPFLLQYYDEILFSDLPIIYYSKNDQSITRNNDALYLNDIFISLGYLIENNKCLAKSSIAFICIHELMLHTYMAYINDNYILNTQISKSVKFLWENFNKHTLKLAYKALSFERKIFVLLIKYKVKPLYMIIYFFKKKMLK